MTKQYELPDEAWDLVADIFSELRHNGRPRTDDRRMLNGALWVSARALLGATYPRASAHGRRSMSALVTGVVVGHPTKC